MTEDRERELLRHVPTLSSLAEARGFRDQLRDAGEQLTTSLYAALIKRMDILQQREGAP